MGAERRLVVAQHLLQRMLEHCLEEKPLEACGILTGRGDRILHIYATDNCRRSPVYFEVDPDQQEQALREMERQGDTLIGIYHSHPTSPARPSGSDIRMAVHFPEAVRVIVSLAGPTEVAAYLIQAGAAREIEIQTLSDGVGEWHDLRAERSG